VGRQLNCRQGNLDHPLAAVRGIAQSSTTNRKGTTALNGEAVAEGSQAQARSAAAPGSSLGLIIRRPEGARSTITLATNVEEDFS